MDIDEFEAELKKRIEKLKKELGEIDDDSEIV